MEIYKKEERGQKEMEHQEIAKENFVLWKESLLTKDPKQVAELYAVDNTFLPTMSPDFKSGTSEAEEYFEHFLKNNPEGEIVKEAVRFLSEDIYLHSGLYDFSISDGNGGRQTVPARFSFVWYKEADGKWRIIHHHSSVKPQ